MKSVFLKLPYLSFYDFNIYREAALSWKGTNLFYLLVLVAVCWLPTAIRLHLAFNDFVEKDGPEIIRQIPEIRFKDGKAFSSSDGPVYIKNPSSGEVIGLIDTGNTTNVSSEKQEVIFILNRETLTVRNGPEASQTWSVSQLGADGATLDKSMLEDWLSFSGRFFAMILFPFAVFVTFVFRMLQIFIYALMIFLISVFTRAELKFENTFRLATIAITPGLLFKAVLDASGLPFQFAEVIMSMTTLGLAAAAVKFIKEKNSPADA